jgi:hypothetical protein
MVNNIGLSRVNTARSCGDSYIVKYPIEYKKYIEALISIPNMMMRIIPTPFFRNDIFQLFHTRWIYTRGIVLIQISFIR